MTHLSMAEPSLSLYESDDLEKEEIDLQILIHVLGNDLLRTPGATLYLGTNSVNISNS